MSPAGIERVDLAVTEAGAGGVLADPTACVHQIYDWGL